MARELPSLTALRAFEAAARHLSFTRAAEELHVTQAAISHQVKGLESHLGHRLFRRLTRRLLLTDEAQALLPVVQDSFDRIARAVEALADQSRDGPLDVMLRTFFAARWLSHRLSRFWALHPGIELRLHHSGKAVDFSKSSVDMAVRWGRGDWPGVECELLLAAKIAPLCSPSLLSDNAPLRVPTDLAHHTLMHEEDYDHWATWLELAGAGQVDARKGPIIDDTNVRIQAAIDGQGLTLAPLSLVSDDLATGRLVAPFEQSLDHLAYYIVYPNGALEQPKVRAFRDWLQSEVAADRRDNAKAA
jgi:LysR family transcriptional regulator, glycine cleavage system transcriptional activator